MKNFLVLTTLFFVSLFGAESNDFETASETYYLHDGKLHQKINGTTAHFQPIRRFNSKIRSSKHHRYLSDSSSCIELTQVLDEYESQERYSLLFKIKAFFKTFNKPFVLNGPILKVSRRYPSKRHAEYVALFDNGSNGGATQITFKNHNGHIAVFEHEIKMHNNIAVVTKQKKLPKHYAEYIKAIFFEYQETYIAQKAQEDGYEEFQEYVMSKLLEE